MTRPGGVQVFHLATMIFVLAAGASAGFASDSPPDLLWPLPIRPAVSSNFCEYREGHLHAGLDIRTFGKEGVPCRASGQGHISRIRASSNGYGKAVYVQLDTGETLVYAHLSEFAQPLEVAVREEQGRRRRYRVDMRFPPGRFPVDAGEVIGYSGMTGATAPHLHFEVRSTREHPLDPFSNGFTVLDELAPHFRALRLIPLDMDARIDGVCYPAEIQPVELEGARFVIRDTLALFGRVGVSVDVFDLLNDESGKLAPYMIELSVDGTTVSTVSFERFSFNHTSQVDFVYEIERIRSRKQYFFQLFRRAGETLWNRDFDSGGGTITPAPAPAALHQAVITARDRSGNEASLELMFREDSDGAGHHAPDRAAAGGELRGLHFFEDMASFYPAGTDLPVEKWAQLLATDTQPGQPIVISASMLNAVPVALPLGERSSSPQIFIVGLRKGEPRSVRFPEIDLELVMGVRTFYTDHILYATRWVENAGAIDNKELTRRSKPVRVGPYSMSMQADMEIRFTGQDYDTSAAVYRLNERKGEWVYYESECEGGTVSTTARRPGVYAVLTDRTAPRVGRPLIGRRRSYATRESVPELVVSIEDTGAGVDWERSAIYIAGVRQIARWDFVSRKMFVELPDPNIMGRQAVSIVAYDQIGNRSQLDAVVVIPSGN